MQSCILDLVKGSGGKLARPGGCPSCGPTQLTTRRAPRRPGGAARQAGGAGPAHRGGGGGTAHAGGQPGRAAGPAAARDGQPRQEGRCGNNLQVPRSPAPAAQRWLQQQRASSHARAPATPSARHLRPPCQQVTTRGEYDMVIRQTEEALQKIVESSQALVAATKKSAADIARLAEQAG